MRILYTALVDIITKACEEKLALTTSQMKDLLKLGLTALRQTQRIASSRDTLQTIWRPDTWDALRKKVLASERFKTSTAVQNMCLQMAKLSQGTISPKNSKSGHVETYLESVVATKRKADIADVGGGSVATKESKRKKVKVKTNN
jgi:DNA polymerase phi